MRAPDGSAPSRSWGRLTDPRRLLTVVFELGSVPPDIPVLAPPITETTLRPTVGVRTMRYFEDLSAGDTVDLGEYALTREEIVSFASEWDPQPFHLEESGAEGSVFDGLVASGLHTLCIGGKLLVEGFMNDVANMGGRGMSDIRWHRPVAPDETLSGRVTVAEKGEPRHPDRGDVAFELTLYGSDGEPVLSTTFRNIVRRRAPRETQETRATQE